MVSLEDFKSQNITKEPRSNTTLDNSLIKEVLGIEFATIDKEWLNENLNKFIEASKPSSEEETEESSEE